MTRITSFGRKRTYVDAGFDDGQHEAQEPVASTSTAAPNPEKKQKKFDKRGPKPKISRAEFSEKRWLKRINERVSSTICFACREKGHAAKDCPTALEGEADEGVTTGKSTVGMCYRCGSTKHNLSRCKKKEDPANKFPFALCFVCSQKGHLASACPKNKDRGIYPNGGSCLLCGEVTHFAKDCNIRKQGLTAASSKTPVVSATREAGADEDEFHTLSRKIAQVNQEETDVVKAKQMARVKVGALTKTVHSEKPVDSTKKKVVYF